MDYGTSLSGPRSIPLDERCCERPRGAGAESTNENAIVSWFSNHHKPLAILKQKTLDVLHKSVGLVKACAMRMGTHTLVGKRLLQLKGPLQATVVDATYVAENYKDLQDQAEEGNCQTITRQHKGGTAKKLVLDDDSFWKKVTCHVNATTPILDMLRRHDTSAPSVGKLYSGWYELGEQLKQMNDCPYAKTMGEKLDERWIYGHADVAAAAYVLDPEFASHEQMTIL